MKTSEKGRKLLRDREGMRLKAYRDTKGILTIGVGHTSAAGLPNVTPGLVITPGEVDAIFARDLVKYETAVNSVVHVPLAQHEFDALTSLAYNIGPGAFAKSTVVRRLNAGDRAGAAAAILMWNKPSEIIPRRKTEYLQFLTPYTGKAPVRVPPPPDVHPIDKPAPAPRQSLWEVIRLFFGRK